MRYLLYYTTFSNFNTSNALKMGSMFYRYLSLNSLNLSNFDASKVSTMGEIFSGCSSLKFLASSNFNTSSVKDMGKIFINIFFHIYLLKIDKNIYLTLWLRAGAPARGQRDNINEKNLFMYFSLLHYNK